MNAEQTKRDGRWFDEIGCCKICDGEIPYGHTSDCDIYKLERQLAWTQEHLRDLILEAGK